jgi:hexosaminidase
LEFVLKLEPYVSLREVRRYPQVVCPTNNRSTELIRDMIDQIMELHPDIKYLHIGSDEVYHIGVCPLCQDRMSRTNIDVSHLFLQHVKSVAKYVVDTHHVKPLMWDDEFRKLDARTIRNSGIGELVELVVWNYHPGLFGFLLAVAVSVI